MCLIVLGWQVASALSADRRRQPRRIPFAPRGAAPRSGSDRPDILAGRDLRRWARGWASAAAASSPRSPTTAARESRRAAESRGALVTKFPGERCPPRRVYRPMSTAGERSTAASTCWSRDRDELWWMSNRDGTPRRLEPGILRAGQPAARLARGATASRAMAAEHAARGRGSFQPGRPRRRS